MKRAILIVDHGSQRAEANLQLEEIARRVQRRAPDSIVKVAHMELAPPDLGKALEACVEAGAQRIVVHPYFLGPGRHTSEDIPRMVAEVARRHPRVEVRVSAPLGVHDALADLVLQRVEEC